MTPLVYLDFAATSALRPGAVVEAVERYLRDVGATPGRSGHRLAVEAGRTTLACRMALAELFGIPGDPGRIVFQLNATQALNTALHGILRPGDRVVRTVFDHNAVRRPLARLERSGVEVVTVGGPRGQLDLAAVAEALRGGERPARMIVLPHASNVLGVRLPVEEVAGLARAGGTLVLLDAAQSAGHLPIDVQALGIDVLAFTGHKGLLGPQGVGGLWLRDGVDVEPPFQGGTGGDSLPAEMPEALPDRLEAGTLNGPGIAGLLAGVRWLQEHGGAARMHERERALKASLHSGLSALPGVRVLSPAAPDGVGIVSFQGRGAGPHELALRLDREHGILTRAGLHCAPDAHRSMGCAEEGAVRMSVGWCTTDGDVERAVAAVAAITGNL